MHSRRSWRERTACCHMRSAGRKIPSPSGWSEAGPWRHFLYPAKGRTPNRGKPTRSISPADGVLVRGRSSAGEYYGVQTLLQMIEHAPGRRLRLPYAHVEDWPALAYRGTLMDAGSEGPMLTFDEVKQQIDFIAKWKGNQYFFYSEGNIELRGYPLLNPQARFTQQQIRALVAYARERHIDVIPAIEMYRPSARSVSDRDLLEPLGFPARRGVRSEQPTREGGARRLGHANWIAFPQPFVDVGFDETWELQKATAQARTPRRCSCSSSNSPRLPIYFRRRERL